MKYLLSIVAVFLSLALIWAAKDITYPSASWRYRMTVVVETPEGVKTGSAVRQIYAYTEPKIFPEQAAGHAAVTGQAVAVDLGKRGILFALMSGGPDDKDYAFRIVFKAFPFRGGHGGELTPDGISFYRSLKTGKVVLTPDLYPMFVRFKNKKDPTSVERSPRAVFKAHLALA